jgi:uncharacterized sulfatase
VNAFASGADLLPTTLELLGLPAQRGLQGQSLVPFWRGENGSARGQVLSSQGYEGYDRISMWRTPDWKLVRYDEGGAELYDLRRDPLELDNLIDAPEYASIRGRLAKEMEDFDRGTPHSEPRFSPGTKPDEMERIRRAFAAWKDRKR